MERNSFTEVQPPKISVITVCFNAIDSIENTIRSVLAQNYPNVEYIVVDGGSKDGTIDIVKKYENRISKWTSEPDRGIYDAMNKGISMATGDWINFRNSGDTFATADVLSEMFAEPVKDSVSILHGDCFFNSGFDYIKLVPPIVSDNLCFKREMPVHHSASFIRRTLHQKMPFDLSYRASADYNFFFKCCEQGCIYEYRPIAVAVFEIGGYTSTHKGVTIRENRRLQGFYRTPLDRFMTELRIKKVEIIDAIKIIITKHSKLVRKSQMQNRKKAGWLPIDGTEPFVVKY